MIYMKNFLLQNMVRADIFPVLWQFGKSAAKPPRLPACLARLRRARQKIRSSYFQYTPPVRIWQVDNCLVPRCGSALGYQFIFIFG